MSGIQMALLGASGGPPLSVTADDAIGYADGPASSGFVVTNNSTNTTAAGGVAPYTYAWSRVSGASPSISSTTAQNPGWSATVFDGVESVSVWRVTVTDSVSSTTYVDIGVYLTWVDTR